LINSLPFDMIVFKIAYANAWLGWEKPPFLWYVVDSDGELTCNLVSENALFLLGNGEWLLFSDKWIRSDPLDLKVAASIRLVSEVK
jgi:hypothetical protein